MKKSEGQDLKKQVFVVGAGASGLMAGISAGPNGGGLRGWNKMTVPAEKSVLRETAVVI